jgi:hypothetical protein
MKIANIGNPDCRPAPAGRADTAGRRDMNIIRMIGQEKNDSVEMTKPCADGNFRRVRVCIRNLSNAREDGDARPRGRGGGWAGFCMNAVFDLPVLSV